MLAVLGAGVMVSLGWGFSAERARSWGDLLLPPAIAFLVVAPVVYRSATDSAGDASLMIGVVIGGVLGVWRGRELTAVGVRRDSGAIVVAGDRWGAYFLAGALLLDAAVAVASGSDAFGPTLGLVGAAAGQLIGWHVGVYGRARSERTVPAP